MKTKLLIALFKNLGKWTVVRGVVVVGVVAPKSGHLVGSGRSFGKWTIILKIDGLGSKWTVF